MTSKNKWSYIIGTGIALSAIHNLWLTNLCTINGKVFFFLPTIGVVIWLVFSLFFINNNWRVLRFTNKWVEIPLLLIVLSMSVTGFITGDTLEHKFAPMLMGLSLYAVYVVARTVGISLVRAFIPFVVIGALISIVVGLAIPGEPNGGMITNYCASAGYLIFGAVINQGKWQWALILLAFVGLFFIGALEGAFIVGVLGITLLVRRDFSKKLLVIAGVLVLIIVLWSVMGYLVPLYQGNNNVEALTNYISNGNATIDDITTDRWEIIYKSLQDIKFFGHGYALSTYQGSIVHNIPLIILYQLGVIPTLAWTFVTFYCLIKTKWKYAWIAVLAMFVFDHYLWTQYVPFVWALIGISTSSTIKSDLIFKESKSGWAQS